MSDDRNAECLKIVQEILEAWDEREGGMAAAKAKLETLARTLGKKGTTPGDLTTRVRSWLGEQGFPLEFRVAQAFAAHGFKVTPSHYVDVDGVAREIDVLATQTEHLMRAPVTLQFYVECKWSRSNPWVIFRSASDEGSGSPVWRTVPHNAVGEGVLWCLSEDDDFLRLPPIGVPSAVGYGGRQALSSRKPDDPDAFYSAMQSVTTIARAGVSDRRGVGQPATAGLRLGFPVVVIDAPLFIASLPVDSNQLHLEQVAKARVHWKGATAGTPSLIDVVTFGGLEEFFRELETSRRDLFDTLLLVLSELAQARAADDPSHISHRFFRRVISPPIEVPEILRGLAEKQSKIDVQKVARTIEAKMREKRQR